jgi:HlyD family secretion protein
MPGKFDELAAVISRSQSDAAGYRDRLGLAQTVEQMRSQLSDNDTGRFGSLQIPGNLAPLVLVDDIG